jgi:hypothetical protein
MTTLNRSRNDVVVVGGRVAGSATAMLLARLGHDVVVVDQASFPSDTISTHSLARSGVVQLQRWGLLGEVLDSGAPAIRQVTFNADGESISRRIKDKAGVDFLVAPRRYVLDTILAAAAERAGADVRPGVTVTGAWRDGRGRVMGCPGMTAPALGSSSTPAASSAPTACDPGSPVWPMPPSTRPAGRPAPPSTPTTRAFRGPASSFSSPRGPSPGCSRPMTGRPASGSAPPRPTPGRSAARAGHGWRRSIRCSSGRTRSWPSGCGRLAAPRRCGACSASPTRSAGRSAGLGAGRGRRLLP